MKIRLYRGVAFLALSIAGFTALAQSPKPETLIDPAAKDYGVRPVAYIYGTVAVTRSDLAEYLIARGGYEKVEALVNKKIIETEASRRGITVTTQEMEKAVADDIGGLGIKKKEFINVVLSKYGKTYYEWMEDVVRPRLLLTAMCKDDVRVTEDDLKLEFERQHGEKRQIQMIIWPKGDDLRTISRVWDEIRKDKDAFDRVARQQANPGLASTGGHVAPIGRHLTADSKLVEQKAFTLKEGDVSEVFETPMGMVVIKCVGVIKPNDKVKFDDERKKLYQGVYDLKLTQEIPKCFAKLREAAKPTLLLNGPPSQWKVDQSYRELAEDATKPAPPPVPAPPKP